MDREVDAPIKQSLFDLLAEQALAAFLGQRPLARAVAAGADGDDVDRAGRGQRRMRRGQAVLELVRLCQRQGAAARADAQKRWGHALFLGGRRRQGKVLWSAPCWSWASKPVATKPRPRWSRMRAPPTSASARLWCCRSSPSTALMAVLCPRSLRAHIWTISTA